MRIDRPTLSGATWRDRCIAGVGAAFGILLTGVPAALVARTWPVPLLIAPIGASAVLVFAVPASPLAQPWPVIGGNVLSAMLALIVVAIVPQPMIAAPLAVGGAIVAMSLLLVGAGRLFHRVSGHSYPHRAPVASPSPAFAAEDIDAALAEMHETFDIARDDLDALLAAAARAAAARAAAVRRERSGRSSPRL